MARDSKPPNRLLVALCFSGFLAALNFLATTPFYSEMSGDLDVSVSVLGQSVTLMIFVSAFLGLAIGPIADRFGYQRPLLIGVVAVAVYLCGVAVAPSFPFILGLSLFGALGDAIAFGVPLVIVGVLYEGAERKRAVSVIVASLSCGGIVGVPLLTLIGSVSSWRVAVLSAGLMALGVTLYISRTVPADRRFVSAPWNFALFREAYRPILSHSLTLRLLGASVARAACWIGFLTYLGAFLSDRFELSTRQIGLVYTVGATGFLAGSLIADRLLRPEWARQLVAVMCIVTALMSVGIAVIDNVWMSVGLLTILAMASSIAAIGVILLLTEVSPAESATTMLLNGSLLNLGGAGGAAIGGAALAIGGYLALGIGLSGFALIGAALVLKGRRSHRIAAPGTTSSDQTRNSEMVVASASMPVDLLVQTSDEPAT